MQCAIKYKFTAITQLHTKSHMRFIKGHDNQAMPLIKAQCINLRSQHRKQFRRKAEKKEMDAYFATIESVKTSLKEGI